MPVHIACVPTLALVHRYTGTVMHMAAMLTHVCEYFHHAC